MRRSGRVGLAVLGCLLAVGGRSGFGWQRNGGGGSGNTGTLMNGGNLPSASDASSRGGLAGSESPFDNASRMAMDERRSKLIISERQRMMTKEADQIVQTAHDLQASLNGSADPSREETFRRAEAIEKLARNVKDRMKGNR